MWYPVFIVVLILTTTLGSEEDLLGIDTIIQENQCRRAGGICTKAGDCPKGHLSEKAGLCPQQLKHGIECCYGVSTRETRCIKRGGICLSAEKFCNPKLVFDGAEDCPENHKCCIMTL